MKDQNIEMPPLLPSVKGCGGTYEDYSSAEVVEYARAASATASIDMFGWYLDGRGWIAQSLCGQDIVDIVPSHWMPRPPFPCESRAQQGCQS